MDLQTALNKIYSMHQFDIKLGLERIKKLLDRIGNPQKGLKYFHIAGSNGKGSTASFIASILMEAGYKVGLYTSPHFVKFNERIRVNGKEIEDSYIADFINSIDGLIEEIKPTFFEITTALAFKYFQECKPDFVVLETGLGGRLDATNIVEPVASIITSISLEHTNILGNSISQIAFEKSGIIKKNEPVFIGKMPFEAIEIISSVAKQSNAKVFDFRDFTEQGNDFVRIILKNSSYHLYGTGLVGYHQLINSALALKTIDETISLPKPNIINKGILNVIKNSGIQGRYEIFSNSPRIIFDSAHNLEGVESFIAEFTKEFNNYEKRTLIFGAMKDKQIEKMLVSLRTFFDEMFVTQPKFERAATIEEMIQLNNSHNFKLRPLPEPILFIENMFKESRNYCLVVLGSIYLLGEIKLKIIEKKLDKKGIEV